MKKIILLFIGLLFISSSITAQIESDHTIGANGGIFWIIGESSEYFDLGYSAGINYEYRFSNIFAIEISPYAAYIYGEHEPIFYGWYVDNYMFGVSVTPKFSIPIGSGGLKIVLAPKVAYTYVNTELEIWLSSWASYYGETTTKTTNGKGIFSFGALGGFEYAVNSNFAFGFNLTYDNLDLNKNMEEFDAAEDYSGDFKPEIKTKRMGLNFVFKFGI